MPNGRRQMSENGEVNGKNGHDPEDEAQVWVVRIVPEKEYVQSGCAAPTGVYLALLAAEVQGMGAWELARLWGYEEDELGAMIESDERFVAIVARASPNVGRATAHALAGLIHGLRPDEADNGSVEDFVEATQMTTGEAQLRGLRDAQRALSRVFGLRDGAFGTGVIPQRDQEDDDDRPVEPAFVVDEKINPAPQQNPLEPGSALRVEDYPELASVILLPWDGLEE